MVRTSDGMGQFPAIALVTHPIWLGVFLSLASVFATFLAPLQTAQAGFRAMVSDLWPPPPPHPAVVRVEVAERGATSHGSGTLFDIIGEVGLVLTNWHVVRDAGGDVVVIFPNGFRSAARVLKVDPDWDLAVLAIWRPPINPMPLARTPPRPGDLLTIAGYGPGQYRAATGRCTQYVAPGMDLPYEMVEVSVGARQGDSGGPMINDRGELAGVLFGSSGNATSGSHIGRVQSFLASIRPTQPNTEPTAARPGPEPMATISRATSSKSSGTPPPSESAPVPVPQPRPRLSSRADLVNTGPNATSEPPTRPLQPITLDQLAGDSTWEKAKSLLAVIGVLALISQLSRHKGSSR